MPRSQVKYTTTLGYEDQLSQSVQCIANCCPNLLELGLSVSTIGDEHYTLDFRQIARLEKLKTLNIRNLPKQSKGFLSREASSSVHETLANKIARLFLNWGHAGLNAIGTGCVTSKDIWFGRSHNEHNLDYYLCPRIYHVAYPVIIRGQRAPALTQVAQGTATTAHEHCANLRIFEPYWLH